MILAGHGIIASSILQVDADWLAYYNRVIAAGGSLTTTEQNATKTLVADLKSAGIWSAMKAIYPMVGASAAACAQNLKSSSFTGTFNGGWTFSSTGAVPNGTTGYMDTGLNPSTVFGSNYAHESFYSRTNNTSGTILQGVSGGGVRFDMGYDAGNLTPFVAIGSSGSTLGVDTSSLGFVLAYRTGASAGKMLRNNVLKVTMTDTFTSYPSANYWLAARNPGLFLKFFENAFSSIGDTLTDTQAGNLNTAVTAFQTTLSRNV
jgi:hypothetical protein